LVVAAYSIGALDLAVAIVRRRRRGDSPFTADKHHFHHRLLRVGLSRNWTIATLHGLAALAVFAVALPYYGPPLALLHFLIPTAMVVGAGYKLMRITLVRDSQVIPFDLNFGRSRSSLDEIPSSGPQGKESAALSRASGAGK
jgi:hypothetical protein